MPSPPQDLADATLQQLRRSPVAALFGDTWDPVAQVGNQRFFFDYVADVPEPYLWCSEISETYLYMSPGGGNLRPFLADGQLGIWILAASRTQARQFGLAVAQTLNDADVTGFQWNTAVVNPLRFLRLMSASFVPITQSGPGIPAVFARQLTFQYEYEGIL